MVSTGRRYRKRQRGWGSSRQAGGFTPTIHKIMEHYDKTRPGWCQRQIHRINLPGRPGYTRKGQAGRGPKIDALKKGAKWLPNIENIVFAKPGERKAMTKNMLGQFGKDVLLSQAGRGTGRRHYKAVW